MSLFYTKIDRLYGIILKKYSFGEGHASFVVLDSMKGKLEIFSFGSDREKSRRRSILLVSNLIEGLIYCPKSAEYWSLKEVNLVRQYLNIKRNLKRLAYMYLLLEVVDIFLDFEELLPSSLFDNIVFSFEMLDKENEYEKYVFYTIFHFFKDEGILPSISNIEILSTYLDEAKKNFTIGDGSKRFIIDILEINDIKQIRSKKISNSVINNLLDFISIIVEKERKVKINSLNLFI